MQLANFNPLRTVSRQPLSGNDPGLDEVAEYFGLRGRRFSAHTNLTLHVLEKADHTLSALWARKRLQHCIAGYMF